MGKQTKQTTQETNAVSKSKRTLIFTLGGILIAILTVIIILSAVQTQARPSFETDGLSSVQVISGKYAWDGVRESTTVELVGGIHDTEIKELANEYDKSTKFSVGYGIMNSLWSPKMQEGDLAPKNVSEIKELSANATDKMIVATYSAPRTVNVVGQELTYDHLYLFVNGTGTQLKTFSVYYIDGNKVSTGDKFYTAQEYKGWMVGSSFGKYLEKLAV